MGVWAYGRMGVWAYGRMGVWAGGAYGRMGVWAYGRMGVWAYGPEGRSLAPLQAFSPRRPFAGVPSRRFPSLPRANNAHYRL